MTTDTTVPPLISLLNELELLSAELERRTAERDAALGQAALLTARINTLQFALERELHRTQSCVEAGIIVGIKEGQKLPRIKK